MTNFAAGLREGWNLATPYFNSEERWIARGLLATVILLNLLMVFFNVILTYWNRDFFNAIQAYDVKTIVRLLYLYSTRPNAWLPVPGFIEIIALYVVVAVYAQYLNQMLQIRWRTWLTRHFMANWLADRAFYNISLRPPDDSGIDNPDQRITEDLRAFTTNTLTLGLDFISNVVTLFSFVFVLYAISGSLKLFGVTIPGYMVWVAILFSAFGTLLTHLIGRKLIPLSFRQQKVEADFRYNLIRVRDNTEGIALYRGEASEQSTLVDRFLAVRSNFWAIMKRSKLLNFFTVSFGQVAGIFPLLVSLPRYLSHAIGLGDLTQIQGVFAQVQGALSWFINVYSDPTTNQDLVNLRATVSRLHGFHEAVAAGRAASLAGPQVTAAGTSLTLANLTLTLPDGRKLVDNASLTLPAGEPVVLSGPSGAGKSTLFRAIAGIWPHGGGAITRPTGSVMFLPQRPYFPLGSLKRMIAYPADENSVTDEAAAEALAAVELGHLSPRLADTETWSQLLSGGEQQRLAIARALLAKPDWLFLDEATAALDPPLATKMMGLIRQTLPNTTIVAITHRDLDLPTSRHLTLTPGVLA